MTAPIDLAATFYRHVEADPGRDAVVTEQAVISYAELAGRVFSVTKALAASGVIPGTTVGVAIADEVEHLVVALALMCLGAPQITFPAHQTVATKHALAQLTGVAQLVSDSDADWAAAAGIATLPPPLRQVIGDSQMPVERQTFAADAPVLYRTTSGTTGTPKAFGVAARFIAAAAERLGRDPWHRRLLRTSSMDFDSTKSTRLTNILAGNSCIFFDDLQLSRLAAFCRDADVTDIHMGTYRFKELVGQAGQGKLPATTRVLTGGARVAGDLRAASRAVTDTLWISYATSEVGVISYATPDQHDAYPEGVGIPISGVTVDIRDAAGAAVEPGEIGLARIAKPDLPHSYLAGSDKGPNLGDGWFYSNDMLSRPEGGPLIFHGRADDLMVLTGLKIFPGPIEDALEQHADVLEAVAYPIRSRVHGDIPVAAVMLRRDAATNENELIRHCRNALGVYGPRKIFIVDAIPHTATGKPMKRLLPSG